MSLYVDNMATEVNLGYRERRAAGQVLVSFGKEDLWLLEALDEYCKATGAARSAIMRKAVAKFLSEPSKLEEKLRDVRARAAHKMQSSEMEPYTARVSVAGPFGATSFA